MKQTTPQFEQHLQQEVSTICTCWRLTRLDGEVFTWTDHDEDLVIGEHTYMSAADGGFDRTALESASNLEVSNLELIGFLGHSIRRDELAAGLFDGAELEVFIVNWMQPEAGGLELRRGTLGEVTTVSNNLFTVELRGLQAALQQVVGEVYSPECRANFCDKRCGLKLKDFSVSAVVEEVETRRIFTISNPLPEGLWQYGVVRFTSGANVGRPMEIKAVDGQKVELKFAMPNLLEAGDTLDISTGCDQRLETCKSYDNVINFRGEPFVPGDSVIYSMLGGR